MISHKTKDRFFRLKCSECRNVNWCSHRSSYLMDRQVQLFPGWHYEVPVFFASAICVVVYIEDKELIPGSETYPMRLKIYKESGETHNSSLGNWHQGETFVTLIYEVNNWLLNVIVSRLADKSGPFLSPNKSIDKAPTCPRVSTTHGVKVNKAYLSLHDRMNLNWRQQNLWSILIEGQCAVCASNPPDDDLQNQALESIMFL